MYKNVSEELVSLEDRIADLDKQIATLRTERRKLQEKKEQVQASLQQRSEASSTELTHWEGKDFEWSSRLFDGMRNTFGMDSFRPLQLSAMNSILSGQDTILLMSTGGGKSLCYQLPASISGGVCLVVCPLVSLMEDQLMALKQFRVSAALLTAASTKEQVQQVQNDLASKSPSIKLIYVTPEKLAKSKRFMHKLEKCHEMGNLKLIAIDEVHCCSQWGHDFRPDYKFLNILKRQFAGVPVLGLTATATAHVIDDVREMLSIPGALVFRAGFNRPNLRYRLLRKQSTKEGANRQVADLIQVEFSQLSGIVYCFSRKETEELTSFLRSRNIKAGFYHAEMDAAHRTSVHEKWKSGHYTVVVATVAFGMGIDKPDVRFVIHHSMAKSMENYYQESGRAGRDEKPADCILLYRLADAFRQSTMVCTEKTGVDNLYAMLNYCICTDRCRRELIAEHFHESWEPDWCRQHCDNCTRTDHTAQKCDAANEIGTVLANLAALTEKEGKKVTALKLVDRLAKDRPLMGRLGASRNNVDDLLATLLIDGYLKEDFHFTPFSIISYVQPGHRVAALAADKRTATSSAVEPTKKNEIAEKRRKIDVGVSHVDEITVIEGE